MNKSKFIYDINLSESGIRPFMNVAACRTGRINEVSFRRVYPIYIYIYTYVARNARCIKRRE